MVSFSNEMTLSLVKAILSYFGEVSCFSGSCYETLEFVLFVIVSRRFSPCYTKKTLVISWSVIRGIDRSSVRFSYSTECHIQDPFSRAYSGIEIAKLLRKKSFFRELFITDMPGTVYSVLCNQGFCGGISSLPEVPCYGSFISSRQRLGP